ncbi:hypothetical protein DPMN_016882 [Dreissena polymorpha]|uniref:Uncharacterized protein n=1 Tax=Dreissena polymorpha TaxID=45954 RepID=A0A9D4S4Y4_DREPO|nr:hypothetical protein DPMN_016882 [Dreissena polymorpha]
MHQEVYDGNIDLETVGKEDLAEKLRKFYCEATPKPTKKERSPCQSTTEMNTTGTHWTISGAPKTGFLRISAETLIQFEIYKNNRSLKSWTEAELSRPTQHKEILSKEDLEKTATYLQKYDNFQDILREEAWYVIAVHFVTRGMEFHHQLMKNSLDFKVNSYSQYIVFNQEIKQKNHQEGACSTNLTSEKRIFATGKCLCPVKILKLFVGQQLSPKFANKQ